jgi:O-antigen/teichoic acid export membrane protein
MSTRVIAKNSIWLSLETIIDFTSALFASIAIARWIGPEKLGYYVFVSWLTRISITLGNVGIPAMAVKYMAEFNGRGDLGIARSIYDRAMRLQALLAGGIVVVGLVLALIAADPAYRIPSVLLVLSVLPSMANSMPSAANNATEQPGKNVFGSFASALIYSSVVAVSLIAGWDLTGIAAGALASRSAEFLIRFFPVRARWQAVRPSPISPELRRKLSRYSADSLVIMLLAVIVFDRSEILFLKKLCPDVRQISFYAVAFNLTENILNVARVFGSSVAFTIRVQYGRNEKRLLTMLPDTSKYLALLSFPMYLGLAAMSGPIIRVYGNAYLPAVPVLAVASILAIPKAFQLPIQTMLQSSERQRFIVKWSLLSAAVNVLADWVLISRYGALGAAYGNGLAQTFAVVGLWAGAVRMFRLKLPMVTLVRLFLAAAIMAVAAWILATLLPPLFAIIACPLLGAILFAALVRFSGAVGKEEMDRLAQMRTSIPSPLRKTLDIALGFLAREAVSTARL